jgi:hypothetical protein
MNFILAILLQPLLLGGRHRRNFYYNMNGNKEVSGFGALERGEMYAN